ncbi:hypothetical protein CBS101457_005791 [Exobasidium rhododendri]|nr:hypothetical protein CBS101457_005791 [Exobasidium rhododendri]
MTDLISIVRQCHNDDPWSDTELVPLLHQSSGIQIGFLRPVVVEAIKESGSDLFASNADSTTFWIRNDLDTHEKRTAAFKRLAEDWRDRSLFPDPLKGWRNELYAIYGPPDSSPASTSSTATTSPSLFHLERSACALFGLVTFGVHATAYISEPEYRIWVPRRSGTKSTWPGYLDNSVAGGITAGDLPFESMVRECGEEAGLEEDLVRRVMRQTGVISYFYRTQPAKWCQPEVEFTYDIPLEPSTILHPVDGEAESFELMTVDEVMKCMRQGQFKANCSMVLIDFLIRHGKLTAENCDCDYLELVSLLHNNLRLPSMKTKK